VKKEGRLHMRIEAELLEQVKAIASARGVTISHLVDRHFRDLVDQAARPKADEEFGVEQA